jgi:hypothetical protein
MIDISTLTAEQKAQLLDELNAAPVGATPATDATVSDPTPAPAPAPAGPVTLDDLNNDPSLITTLTQQQAFDLYNLAESTAATLAGSLFQQLYAASATPTVTDTTSTAIADTTAGQAGQA